MPLHLSRHLFPLPEIKEVVQGVPCVALLCSLTTSIQEIKLVLHWPNNLENIVIIIYTYIYIYSLYINHFHHYEKNIIHPGMHVNV